MARIHSACASRMFSDEAFCAEVLHSAWARSIAKIRATSGWRREHHGNVRGMRLPAPSWRGGMMVHGCRLIVAWWPTMRRRFSHRRGGLRTSALVAVFVEVRLRLGWALDRISGGSSGRTSRRKSGRVHHGFRHPGAGGCRQGCS